MEKAKNKHVTNCSSKIVIGLCTFHRNDLLDGALESLSRIDLPSDVNIEFVLVDNDEKGNAKPIFDGYQNILPFKSYYFIESRQGIVYARNRVLEEALKLDATEIAFFDDDEIVSQEWLISLWNFYKKSSFIGVGGPVYRLFPSNTDKVLLKFWPNTTKHKTKSKFLIATGNCLFSTNLIRADGLNLRYDEFFNQIGGEDGKFAMDALQTGGTFAFVKEAIAIERFTKERATFRYLFKRHFGGANLVPLILRKFNSKKYLTFIAPNIFSCIWRIIFIPFFIFGGKFHFLNNLLKITQSIGTLAGFCGYSYKYYKPYNKRLDLKNSTV